MENYYLIKSARLFTLMISLLYLPQVSFAQRQNRIITKVDISVVGSVSNRSVPSGSNVDYNLVVSNIGTSMATEVALIHHLPPLTTLIEASSSVGFCHNGDGKPFDHLAPQHDISAINSIYCNLGDLAPNSRVNLTITVKTIVFGDGIDLTPFPINSRADISANEEDRNPSNNHLELTFDSLPSTNKVPNVAIVNLAVDSIFTTSSSDPVNIPVQITASDADGSIAKVGLYDSGNYVGDATLQERGSYEFNLITTETRPHVLTAVAIDNDGRESLSIPVPILINSPHTISITKPTQTLIAPGTAIDIETESNVVGNRIQKVEIIDTGILLGKMRIASVSGSMYKHRLTLPNISRGYHNITAILTDVTGAVSVSPSLSFKVTNRPTFVIISPIEGAGFGSNTSIDITVETADSDGYVKELKFYANGRNIGIKSESIENGESTFRWISPDDGEYSITVVATDDTDETVRSDAVRIRIMPRRSERTVTKKILKLR